MSDLKRHLVLLLLVSAAVVTASAALKTGDTRALVLPGGVNMALIYCAPGEFMMGSENGESCEKPIHKVRLTYGFWMGKYEVTQKQWKSVMGTNPSARKGDYLPVDSVRRGDCDQFMRKIEAYCHGVRAWLPTEAQWEYACRAGTTDEYAGVIDCWYLDAKDCRSARRHAIGFGAVPEQLIGFRICCVLPGELVFSGKRML